MSNDDIETIITEFHELTDRYAPASAEAIEEFQTEIGYRLPSDYKAFLRLRNGGILRFRSCYDDWPVNILFGLLPGESNDLRGNRVTFSDRLPEGILAIGDGRFYTRLCMSLLPANHGEIIAWSSDDGDFEEHAEPLCESFRELLLGLAPSEDEWFDLTAKAEGVSEPFRSIILDDYESFVGYLDEGDDPDCRNENEQTPLMKTVTQPWLAKLLLDRGANLTLTDANGQSALHHAARTGSSTGVKLLLSAGADPHATDDEGRIPLDLVLPTGEKCFELLYVHTWPTADAAEIDEVRRTRVRRHFIAWQEIPPFTQAGREVFFLNATTSMPVTGSGFVVECSGVGLGEEIGQTSLDQLIELVPSVVNAEILDDPVAVARLELCQQIVRNAGSKVVPDNREVTLGDISNCIGELYQSITATTHSSQTNIDVERQLSETLRRQLEVSLHACLRRSCLTDK